MLDRTGAATAADSMAREVRLESGGAGPGGVAGGMGILDPLATRTIESWAPTRCRFRIVCKGQPHIPVAGYQVDGEG